MLLLLPPMIGPGRAAELLLTGASVGADDALAWGLVNRVVPRERLDAAVDELAATIVACAPTAVRLQKALIVRWRESDLTTAVRAGIAAFAASYATGEPREDGPPRDVAVASGAALLVRRAAFEQLGGYHPSCFLYYDDVDLAWRARLDWAPMGTPSFERTGNASRS